MVPSATSGAVHIGRDHEISLLSGPIHYDILLPLDAEIRTRFGFAARAGLPLDHPDAQWLVIGWGAREFYTTTGDYSDVTARAILKGVFGDRSVMRLDLAGELPEHPDFQRVRLTSAQNDRLLAAIVESFARDAAGNPIWLVGESLSGSDVFFAAHWRFSLFRTCNAWVGKMLRAAGVNFGIWTPLPISVRLSHWLHLEPSASSTSDQRWRRSQVTSQKRRLAGLPRPCQNRASREPRGSHVAKFRKRLPSSPD